MQKDKKKFNNQESFIWELLLTCFSQKCTDEMVEIVSLMYEQNFEFSAKIEILLVEFWEKKQKTTVYEIAEEVLRGSFFGVEKHFYIVSKLVENKVINIKEAVCFLDINVQDTYSKLDGKIKHIIDVMWLVKEDDKDVIMSPDDDDMLLNSLSGIRNMY